MMSDDDDDGGLACSADPRIAVMIPALVVALCLTFLSGAFFLLSHRSRGRRKGQIGVGYQADVDADSGSAIVKSAGSTGQRSAGGDAVAGNLEKEEEDEDEGGETLRFLGKVLGLATGVAAEALAFSEVAFILK